MRPFARTHLKIRFTGFFKYWIWLWLPVVACRETPPNPVYSSLTDSVTYTGMQSCRSCHEDKFQTFRHTGMGLSFDSASLRKSSARFDHKAVYDKHRDFYYSPYWSGDSLFIKEFRLNKKDTVYMRTERVNYIIGSGQHTNSHMTNINGYLTQVPITYYTQKGRWDLAPGFENGYNSRFSRKIELECLSCHNAYPEKIQGSENKYTKIPNGIDCERCHGPGSVHVERMKSGKYVETAREIDYSIVNPAKLPVDLQLDVCQRCHIQGNAVLKEGKSFYDFRPGMHLHEVMDVYMPVFKDDESTHIMASHVERMKQSACFIQSLKKAESVNPNKSALFPYRNAMTCVTCHNPHVSVRETDASRFNNACMGCHYRHPSPVEHNEVAKSDRVCTGDPGERKKTGDNCISCHMPSNSTIDIPHVSTTDHFIRKPVRKEEVERIKEFVTLACINNPGEDRRSRGTAFLNYFEKFEPGSTYLLDSAKKYFLAQNADDIQRDLESLVRYAFLKNDYTLVVKYSEAVPGLLSRNVKKTVSNEESWTCYRIGESYYRLEKIERALQFLGRAADLAPYNLDFRIRLANVQFQGGQIENARENLEFILRENPKIASAYVNLGFLVLSVDHNLIKADSCYNIALSLEPDNEQALMNKAGTLYYMDKKKEAREILIRLLKINPAHIEARILMNSLQKS